MRLFMAKSMLPMATVVWLVCCPAMMASSLELSSERDAIFSPGQVKLAARLTNGVSLADAYEMRVALYVGGTLIRERTAVPGPERVVELIVPFPSVRSRTEARCRAELWVAGKFAEAREIPAEVWPVAEPVPPAECPPDVWVLDASGRLHAAFSELGVGAVDAAFQGIRDFAVPSVVFVGENSDLAAVQRIVDRVQNANRNCTLVLLRQRAFPESLNISTGHEPLSSGQLVSDMDEPLLDGLTGRDVMALMAGTQPVVIKTAEPREVRSLLTVAGEEEDAITTFLATVRDNQRLIVICQLPVADPDDPRQVALLYNLVRFAGDTVGRHGGGDRPNEGDVQ